MTFVSELVEPWEPNTVAVLFSLVLGGTPVVASSRPWLFLGRRLGLPPFLISPSTCGLPFPSVSLGREGAVGLDCGCCWPLGSNRKT